VAILPTIRVRTQETPSEAVPQCPRSLPEVFGE
jgi:hypothetical protein